MTTLYFKTIFESSNNVTPNFVQLAQPNSVNFHYYVTTAEIESHLKKKKKSSPGIDNISSPMVLANIEATQLLLNMCLLTNRIPDAWRMCKTVLIPKKVSSRPEDQRPITITSILYRTLTGIIARRLQRMISLSSYQKGFIPSDGIHQAITMVRSLHRRQKKIASIDIQKAFDNVPFDAIFAAAKAHGIDQVGLDFIHDIYRDGQTRIYINGAKSAPIKFLKGVKQGDPLSPILFNLVIDQLLHTLSTANKGIKLGTHFLAAIGYADDMILFGKSTTELSSLLATAVSFLNSIGLDLNVRKCFATVPGVAIDGNILEVKRVFKYLGAVIDCDNSARFSIEEFEQRIALLDHARLRGNQKLCLLRFHLLPAVLHRLVHEKSIARWLELMDTISRNHVRRWLHLPSKTSTAFFHLSNKYGGLGIMQLRYAVPSIASARLTRIQNSPTWFLVQLTKSEWYRKELSRVTSLCPVGSNQDRLLNDMAKHNPGHLNFLIGGSKLLNRHLSGRGQVVGGNFNKFVSLRSQDGGWSRARQTNPCRHQCGTDESLYHVLNDCRAMRTQYGARHDQIMHYLANQLRSKGLTVYVEKRFVSSDGRHLIPDLIAHDHRSGKAYIMDVGISFELVRESLNRTDLIKRHKYNDIRSEVGSFLARRLHATSSVECYGLVFGSRGSIAPVTLNILTGFGLSLGAIEKAMSKTVYSSYDILRQFRTTSTEQPSSTDATNLLLRSL